MTAYDFIESPLTFWAAYAAIMAIVVRAFNKYGRS